MRRKILLIPLTALIIIATLFSMTVYAADKDAPPTKSVSAISNNSPIIKTNNAKEVTALNAVLSGNIQVADITDVSEYGFFIGKTPEKMVYKISKTPKFNKKIKSKNEFSYKIDFIESEKLKLTPETKYYYRSYAIINGIMAYGETKSFKTKEVTPWKSINGFVFNDDKEIVPNLAAVGVDISCWQGDIDWEKVKEEIDFAIIRIGYGTDKESQDDERFLENVQGCIDNDIPFGVYIYSYARNTWAAKSEAKHVLRMLDGIEIDFPVYYDMEDKSIEDLSNRQLAANAEVFCETVQDAGYEVGIYANWRWWHKKLIDERFDNETWHRWVALWDDDTYKCDMDTMWQYTNYGYLDGIDGRVDLNYYYKDNSKIKDFDDLPILNDSYKIPVQIFKNIYIEFTVTQ